MRCIEIMYMPMYGGSYDGLTLTWDVLKWLKCELKKILNVD